MKIRRSTARLVFLFFVIASFSGLFLGQAAYSQEQNRDVPLTKKPPQMMMERGQMMPGMMMCPMMQGMQGMQGMQERMWRSGRPPEGQMLGGRYSTGMGKSMLQMVTVNFHQWFGALMSRKEEIQLSGEQLNQIDRAMTEHLQSAIRGQAESRSLSEGLRYRLRQPQLDLSSVENELRQIMEQEIRMQMEGIGVYRTVLDILSPDQQARVTELIGSPFPPPWRGMVSGVPDMSAAPEADGEEDHQAHH
jgi:hypothetical protein